MTHHHPHLRTVRLELARTHDYPQGSSDHGYEFVAPLDTDGSLAADLWRDARDKCVVTRFWGDEPERQGKLRHSGNGWRFDYDAKRSDDDEPFFKLDRHKLLPGSYVTITEDDGVQRPFRVVSVIG
jgi:hypothetical protein